MRIYIYIQFYGDADGEYAIEMVDDFEIELEEGDGEMIEVEDTEENEVLITQNLIAKGKYDVFFHYKRLVVMLSD